MSTIKDFENAPVGATATHALWSRAMKIDDGEQCWFTPGGNRYNNGGMVFWNYTLDAPAPTSAREALGLAWDLAHEVKEGQHIPEGTRYLMLSGDGLMEFAAHTDFTTRAGEVPEFRTLEPLPDPEPDWLDAPAVIAWSRWDDVRREKVWSKADECYKSTDGEIIDWSDLRDVTPLWPEGKTHEVA